MAETVFLEAQVSSPQSDPNWIKDTLIMIHSIDAKLTAFRVNHKVKKRMAVQSGFWSLQGTSESNLPGLPHSKRLTLTSDQPRNREAELRPSNSDNTPS